MRSQESLKITRLGFKVEIKFFSSKFLVQKYLKYSTEDVKLNKKLKEEEIEENNEDDTSIQEAEAELAKLIEEISASVSSTVDSLHLQEKAFQLLKDVSETPMNYSRAEEDTVHYYSTF